MRKLADKMRKLSIVLYPLLLAACADDPQKIVLGAQHTFNAAAKAENAYAAQPFCGSPNAPKPPACADAKLVTQLSESSSEAQDLLDGAKEAVTDPNLDKDSVSAIVTAALTAVGKFGGILAKYQIPVTTTTGE
jgi:hypothetical protein